MPSKKNKKENNELYFYVRNDVEEVSMETDFFRIVFEDNSLITYTDGEKYISIKKEDFYKKFRRIK